MNKKVVFHIDDIWLSQSTNRAAFDLLNNNLATSWSIMIPCSWVEDIISNYKKELLMLDLWIHLTLTSEWPHSHQKRKPTLPINDVKSLVDSEWYFYSNIDNVFENANHEEIKKELWNQIELAKKMGIRVSHIDSHMWVLLHKRFFHIYKEVALISKIQPFLCYPLLDHSLGNWFFDCNYHIDELRSRWFNIYDHYDYDSLYWWNDFNEYEEKRMEKIKEGTTLFLIHVLTENLPPKDLIPDYLSRINEYKFLKSHGFHSLLKKFEIQSITTKEMF